MKTPGMIRRRRSRQGSTGRGFRSSCDSPAAAQEFCCLGFHRGILSLRDQKETAAELLDGSQIFIGGEQLGLPISNETCEAACQH
jgi:hypothetical protein